MREYWNKYKWMLLITSVVILLPILGGVLLWDIVIGGGCRILTSVKKAFFSKKLEPFC